MEDITITEEFKIDDQKYGITIVFLENAISLFLYEESPIFGTFSVSVPGTAIMPASTLYITGSKNEQFVRVIGERLATKLQKLVLVSLNLESISNDLLITSPLIPSTGICVALKDTLPISTVILLPLSNT